MNWKMCKQTGHDLILEYYSGIGRGKQRKTASDDSRSPLEIWTLDLPNTKQKC
jgi:hypothetical protein